MAEREFEIFVRVVCASLASIRIGRGVTGESIPRSFQVTQSSAAPTRGFGHVSIPTPTG